MFIMDTRDEIVKLQRENDKLKHDFSEVQTESVMLKKYFSKNSPFKFSKEKFDNLQRKYEEVKKEAESVQKDMTESLFKSNKVITTLLTEIKNGANNSMMSLHNLIYILENKISRLVKESEQKRRNNADDLYSGFGKDSQVLKNTIEDIQLIHNSPK